MNYKESVVTGNKWTRSHRVICDNKFNGDKSIQYLEEEIIQLSDKTISQPLDGIGNKLIARITDPYESFPIINMETGEVVRMATVMELYAIISSHYLYTAMKRDAMREQAYSQLPDPVPEAIGDALPPTNPEPQP